MTNRTIGDYPIDVVITWVDGDDELWQQKITPYLEKKIDWSNKKDTLRFQSIDEISYSIRSIIKFAPFVRNIFLVTDNQKPASFDELVVLAKHRDINLKLVDHKEIFKGYEHCLPTFNARSIGTMLFRIKGLADHFIYFADDFFFMKEVKDSDFFINGQPIIRGQWAKFYEDRIFRKFYLKTLKLLGIKNRVVKAGSKKAQQFGAKYNGLDSYVKLHHTPKGIRKSTIESIFNDNPSLLEHNIKYRLRSEHQFLISSLAYHREIKNGTCKIQKNLQLTYFQSYKSFFMVKIKLWWFLFNKNKLFTCFQSLDIADEKTINYIKAWMNKRLSS